MRHLALGLGAAFLSTLSLCPRDAAADDAALSLAFSLQAERCELSSVMSLPQSGLAIAPLDAPSAWSVRVEDAAGNALWRRSLPAPRAFDQVGDLPSIVVTVVPMPSRGARFVLQDAEGHERCSRIVDDALLRRAQAHRRDAADGLRRAREAGRSLRRVEPQSALGRQLAAKSSTTPASRRPEAFDLLPPGGYEATDAKGGSLQPSHMVSGNVASSPGYAAIRVRAFDPEGRFVRSVAGAPFAFRVPEGVHRFELDPDSSFRWSDDHWVYQAPVSTAPLLVAQDLVLPDFAWPTQRVELTLLVERPCGLEDSQVHLDMVAPDGRRIDRMLRQLADQPPPARPPGQCASEHLLWLSPGAYSIDVAPLGWAPQRLELELQAGSPPSTRALTFAAADRTEVWQGTVLDSHQLPIGAWLRVRNANQDLLWVGGSDGSNGQFEAPFRPGWSIEITPLRPADDPDSLRSLLRYGSTPPATTLSLERVDFAAVPGSGALRIFGDGNRRRLDLLFVAEGYAGVAETYTDVDGNGTWDGVVWHDLDADGVFGDYDRVEIYGDAALPQLGSDPTAANEPFVDLNADGVLSLDDSALFLANVEAFVRSLFGSDVWAEHRHAFNVYVLFEPSVQAGHDVYDVNGVLRVQRDTRYAAGAFGGGATLTMNSGLLAQRALLTLPQVDVAVGLINQPIRMGSAYAMPNRPGLIVAGSGPTQLSIDDTLPSHELAHLVAGLCDEYTSFSGAHVLPPPDFVLPCANATTQVDAAQLPWAHLLPTPLRPFPSRDRDGSIGLYEGADKFLSGRYRPTRNSTMRGDYPYFNLPSRHALETALAPYTGVFGSGFEE